MEQSAVRRYIYAWLAYPVVVYHKFIEGESLSAGFLRGAFMLLGGLLGILFILGSLAFAIWGLEYQFLPLCGIAFLLYLFWGQAMNLCWQFFTGELLF